MLNFKDFWGARNLHPSKQMDFQTIQHLNKSVVATTRPCHLVCMYIPLLSPPPHLQKKSQHTPTNTIEKNISPSHLAFE